MKADEDVKMIKPDALVLVVKSTELFIGQPGGCPEQQ